MSQPVTRYAKADDVSIAYQVIGDGPVDLVWVYGLASNVEVFWEEPSLAAFFRRLAEFSRLLIFDRRGCGLSDRGGVLTTPTLEERADDILAVLEGGIRAGLDPRGIGGRGVGRRVRVDPSGANEQHHPVRHGLPPPGHRASARLARRAARHGVPRRHGRRVGHGGGEPKPGCPCGRRA